MGSFNHGHHMTNPYSEQARADIGGQGCDHRFPHALTPPKIAALLLIGVALLSLPSAAYAATWPLPASRHSPSLAFHATYEAQGHMFTHSGIDIAASPGQEVLSPVSGVVSFVGAVPSGDSLLDGAGSGQTMDAVSVRMDDGRTVTLMPVASVSVRSGQSMREGDAVGTLAATGDRSSSAAHLHMGLKRGRTYYDPMTLFGAISQTAAAERGEEAASAPAEASPEDLSAEPQWESVAETTPVAADVAEGVPESAGISSGAVQWEPAPDQEGSPLSMLAGAAAAFVDACRLQATTFGEGLRSLATTLHMPQAVLALLLGLVATILTAAAIRGIVLLVSRRRALPAAICQLVLVQERRR